MTKVMDKRIARRRQEVGEAKARRRLRRILAALALAGLAAFGAWFLRSPSLSIREIRVEGAAHTDPAAVLAAAGVVPGVPTIDVRAGSLAARLAAEPWIATARVAVSWPGTVTVTVVEHHAVAVVGESSAVLVAEDATVLGDPEPGSALPVVDIVPPPVRVGERLSDRRILGALEFLENLPGDVATGLTIAAEGENLLVDVRGHRVRLGHPNQMAEKARVLTALLATDLPFDASIDLIAPTRPAVSPPQVEGEGESPPKGEGTG